MKKNLTIPFVVVFISLLFFSCIKDTDFDQADDIAVTPVIELNLIHFNVTGGDFFDTITSTPILTLRDTTEIRFLDDQEIQESLKRAEFYFKFTNSIPRDFLVNFQFLSEANDTTYETQANVITGSTQAPVITEFVENVEGDAILQLTQASKVVVSVTIPSSSAELEGALNLQSKTTYYLEF
ncbi:MAG: hypothetical protein K8F54_08010 [Altibacter sp.]|uniref:hypothetical protein n=1 Tax=Altibacter sp. TaxID=2024823 RepID=UPI001DDA2B24|nr:hypothetical protein [Altibacter sp.]MBZ0327530.1 hypothetical protein [Altibacter sp.]